MRSIKSVLVALVAVLAFGAVAASGASAHEFRVEGKALSGEEAFTGTSGTAHFVIAIGGAEIKFECTKAAAKGDLQGGGKVAPGLLSFTGCVITKSKLECGIAGEKFSSSSIGSDLNGLWASKGLGIENTGLREGESFSSIGIVVLGKKCSLGGSYEIGGKWICELHEAGVEAVEHEQVCRKEEGDLWFSGKGDRLTMEYVEKVAMISGKKWSAV